MKAQISDLESDVEDLKECVAELKEDDGNGGGPPTPGTGCIVWYRDDVSANWTSLPDEFNRNDKFSEVLNELYLLPTYEVTDIYLIDSAGDSTSPATTPVLEDPKNDSRTIRSIKNKFYGGGNTATEIYVFKEDVG